MTALIGLLLAATTVTIEPGKDVVLRVRAGQETRVVLPGPLQRGYSAFAGSAQLQVTLVGRSPATFKVTAGASGSGRVDAPLAQETLVLQFVASRTARITDEIVVQYPSRPPVPAVATPKPVASPAVRPSPVPRLSATPTPLVPRDPRPAPSATPTVRPSSRPIPSPLPSPSAPTAPSPSPTVKASPSPSSPPVPPPSPAASPEVLPSTPPAAARPICAGVSVDAGELALLSPVKIGRREGLTGRLIIELEDALRSERSMWLRFRVVGGSAAQISSVKWEHGDVSTCAQTVVGKDLRLVVQLPRQLASKKTRVVVRLSQGGTYTFALSSPWFSSFLSSLF